MSTQKAKFELFQRLGALGFTYDESAQLRRIEMTLQRWAERECGDGSNWAIERDETTGKPFNVYHGPGERRRYPIADREAGALKRLAKVVADRNLREANRLHSEFGFKCGDVADRMLVGYHQGDCRGCMLYLVKKSDLQGQLIDQVYHRGLAVCA